MASRYTLLKAGDSDEGVSAHKLVLAARSEVFKKMLESDEIKASAKLETVTLSEMKHEEVEALVEFMYSVDGSISVQSIQKHARALYLAADKYEILHLRDVCRKELIYSPKSSNALNILELAQIPFDKVLNDSAFQVIRTDFDTIANSDEFKLFAINHPDLVVEIIQSYLAWTRSRSICSYCGSYCSYCT